jgi:hypothetical protein
MNTDPEQNSPFPPALSRRKALKTGATGMAWLLTLSHIPPALVNELAQLTQNQPMTCARLAGILQTERTRWNGLLAEIGPARMEEPGVVGTWSIKQLVAHLTWYERQIVEGAQQVLQTGKFVRPNAGKLGIDERNARIAEESQARPLSDVLAESDMVFNHVLHVIMACPTELLNDAQRLGLPNEVVPWMAIANNSYAHYREHEPDIRAWLAHTT